MLSTTSPVEAGSCSTANQPAGTARCADTADPSDGTETLTTPANGSFTVTDAPGFGLDVQAANSKGIVVNSHADNTNTDISVDLDGNVKATDNALEIDQDGTGATTVTMDGTLTSTGGAGFFANVASTATGAVMLTTAGITAQGHGIRLVKYQGSGATTITANGDIDAEDRAISITDRGAENLNIIASGALDGHGGGMRVNKGPTGTGAIDIRASGGITSANGRGIYTSNPSLTGGSINIDTTGGAVQAKTQGVQVGHDGVGAITITTDDVTSTDEEGIRAISSTNQTGNFEITANGNVTGGKQGISADNRGTGALTVTTGSSSVVTSNTAEGINARSSTRQTGNFEITANGNVTGATHGILATNAGSGALMVTTGAGSVVTSTSSGTHYAIHAVVDQHIAAISSLSQVMTITVNGDIGTSSSDSRGGIWARHSGLGNLNVTVNGDVFSGLAGVHAYHSGRGNIDVAINGAVNGGTHGVRVNHHQNDSNGNLPDNTATVALNNNVEGDIGLLVDIRDAGNSSMITVGRTDGTAVTVTGTDGTAVDLDGAGSHSFTLRSGATLAGGIDASGATGGTTLDISGAISATGGAGGDAIKFDGAGNHTVILRGGADITGRIEKGTAGNVAIRIEGDLTANPIRWSNRSTQASANSLNNFDGGDSIVIADNSRVEFATGTGLNAIPVDLHGRLVFSGISDTQQVQLAVLRGMGGEIEMDINFADGDRERSSARLALNNLHNSAMRIPVNIRAANGFPEFNENLEFIDTTLDTDGDGSITIGQVIQTHGIGNLGEEHFVRGVVLDNGIDDGNWVLELVCIGCDDPLATPTWSVRATPTLDAGTGGGPGDPGGPAVLAGPATLFDTLPVVLAHLGQPESMHARTRNRSFQADTGVWGRIQTGNLSVEPSAASFETGIRNVTFGVQTPLRAERMGFTEPVTLDANITIQTADTEALIMVEDTEETQEIETNALIAGFAATWERDELYVDGQFQYARFDNNLDAADGTKLASPTADSFSAGLEVGLVFEAGDLRLGKWLDRGVLSNILITPSAQVSWSQVGFSDFVASDGRSISLDDGSVANGRLGTVVEALWEKVVFHDFLAPASVRLQTNADVIVPLDGKVVTQVDGVDQPSELEDLVLDTGVGVFYTWEREDHTYTISADVSSRQGSEVEDYRGSLGFKYRF